MADAPILNAAPNNIDASDPELSVHPTWKEVDLDALAANFGEVRRRVGPGIKIIASVKANAYGHGVARVARALEGLGVHAFATGSFEDASAMRDAGIRTRILMFAGGLPEGVGELLRLDLTPTVYDLAMAQAISKAATKPVSIYVKVDSGLGRLGVPVNEAREFVRALAALPRLNVEGLYTHLPFGDPEGRAWAMRRLADFHRSVRALEAEGQRIEVTQALASAGIITGIDDICTAVCPGHLLYGGLSGVTGGIADYADFQPVLTGIRTRLIHVGRHRAGQAVGVGGKLAPDHDRTFGVVPIGLYDGLRRPVAGRTAHVLMRGRRVPLISVSLEYATIDLSGIDSPQTGEEVVVLGRDGDDQISLEEIANSRGSSPLEVLMTFDRRLPCRYASNRRIV